MEMDDRVAQDESWRVSALNAISNTARERLTDNSNLKRVDLSANKNKEEEEIPVESVHAHLFKSIPSPYPTKISDDFQRIHITETSEDFIDRDASEACSKIQRALSMRAKWMAASNCVRLGLAYPKKMSSSKPLSASGGGSASAPLRRREELPYDPFSQPVPPKLPYYVKEVNGVYLPYNQSSSAVFDEGNTMCGSPSSLDYANDNAAAAATESASSPPSSASKTGGPAGHSHAKQPRPIFDIPPVEEYFQDYFDLKRLINTGSVKTLAYKHLQLLEAKFHLHTLLNSEREVAEQKSVPHRDFYNVRKVDTHVHHSACMNQKHLLRFIKYKLKRCPDEIVSFRDGRFMTLQETFESLHLTAYDLSIDTLDMHANNTFHRFDRFNLKYNPAGESRLREIFLKTDNLICGSYLAQVTKEVMDDLTASKYQIAEWRVSIYGRKLSEWDKLARWFYSNRLCRQQIRWMIQIPRLYYVYKHTGQVDNFGEMIRNIFAPLFQVSVDPSSNLPLHTFLLTVVGFDSVDDESKVESIHLNPGEALLTPAEWSTDQNPPYSYWMFYLYANISALNKLRALNSLNTFEFRPHCGEAGDVDHLVSAYLLAQKINHGILLRKLPGLQYLYYLSQVGIAMSPLSNNRLFLDYNKNPFPKYYAQGLNVSLSTDDPLMLHYTKDPLLEEYSVAAQVWKLSSTDQCEIARNSVLQSGLEETFKQHFLGRNYRLPGKEGNDITLTNVPDTRLQYRREMLEEEIRYIRRHAGGPA